MIDPSRLLERNFASESDRSWKMYLVHATRLKQANQMKAATKLVESGLAYFGKAEDVWPDAIRFYGEAQGWEDAKRMAADCGKKFRRAAPRCVAAATSPAERAEAERKTEAKAEQLIDKWIKKRR